MKLNLRSSLAHLVIASFAWGGWTGGVLSLVGGSAPPGSGVRRGCLASMVGGKHAIPCLAAVAVWVGLVSGNQRS